MVGSNDCDLAVGRNCRCHCCFFFVTQFVAVEVIVAVSAISRVVVVVIASMIAVVPGMTVSSIIFVVLATGICAHTGAVWIVCILKTMSPSVVSIQMNGAQICEL